MIVCDNTFYFCDIPRILTYIISKAPLKENLNNLMYIVTNFFL